MKRTEYFKKIYQVVARIPRGRVATYGQLAYLAGFPQAPRIAGQSLCFAPPGLPCHRCVNSVGRLAPDFPGQRALLMAEGISFRPNGNVDLKRHLWDPFEDSPFS